MRVTRRGFVGGATVASNLALQAAPARLPEVPDFLLSGKDNIVEEEHFGVINGHITFGVAYQDTFALRGLFAPPYASSNFALDVRLYGERVPSRGGYEWRPVEVRRAGGTVRDIAARSEFVLAAGQRAAVLAITLHNTAAQRRTVPVQFDITGSFDFVGEWHFARPRTEKQTTTSAAEGRAVIRENAAGAFAVASDVEDLRWEPWSSHWEGRVTLAPGERATRYAVIAAGPKKQDVLKECDELLRDPAKAIALGRADFARRTRDLFDKLPRLEASDPRLVQYYNRSLVHFLLNQWRVPEFVLQPYYSTGSIKGGCVGNYLWNYGGPYEIFPLYDAPATRQHILQFLRVDTTKHFLFNPVDGKASGPWYPVNQEKILLSIYHYVLHTGDVQFLNEVVDGRSVLDWAVYHALYKDDLSQPAVLISYGNGNNHLELRTRYRYDDYMPDLNGRRYLSYLMAFYLTEMAGKPQPMLVRRAEDLKALFRKELWSSSDKWFWFRYADGRKELRYTVQMFKMLGSPVLDEEQLQGLVGHLNREEFLSEFGLHSMSKKDPAYDQVDIDNGGGGNCLSFTPRIAELLYRAGYPDKAEELIETTLWWGERLPYWSDSLVANQVEYRKDTPLQNGFDGTCGAQSIIFGMFGVRIERDGSVRAKPRPPRFSPEIALRDLRVRGRKLDIVANRSGFKVISKT